MTDALLQKNNVFGSSFNSFTNHFNKHQNETGSLNLNQTSNIKSFQPQTNVNMSNRFFIPDPIDHQNIFLPKYNKKPLNHNTSLPLFPNSQSIKLESISSSNATYNSFLPSKDSTKSLDQKLSIQT